MKKTKLLPVVLLLSVLLAMTLFAVTASAEGNVAKIGETEYATVEEAITAAVDGNTITILASDTYTLPSFSKTLTIKAAEGIEATIDVASAVTLSNAKVVFENLTFDYYPNKTYVGLQHTDSMTYNNCVINGQIFLYGNTEIFNNCTFNQNDAESYNVWTYGAKQVEFNNCTFNCVGKSVLVYNEGGNGSAIEVADCEFVASAPKEGKAAIEIDSSLLADGKVFSISTTGETTATGFATGSNSGSTLWNDKKGTSAEVTVNGEKVLSLPQPATSLSLTQFVNAVIAGNGTYDGEGVTVEWSPVSGCRKENCDCGLATAVTETPMRVNSNLAQYQLFSSLAKLNISNVNFKFTPAAFTIDANSGWSGSYTAENVRSAELHLYNTDDVMFTNCTFDAVVLTPWKISTDVNEDRTVTVTECTFKNIYNAYAIKDIQASNVVIQNNTFVECGGGIMLSNATAGTVSVSKNTFTNVDAASSAAEGKVGTRGLIQIASNYTVADTSDFSVTENTSTGGASMFRLVGATVEQIEYSGNTIDGTVSTGNSAVTLAVQVGNKYYTSLAEAIAAAQAGDTITLVNDIIGISTVTIPAEKNITIDLCGRTIEAAVRSDNAAKHYYAIDNYGTLVLNDSVGGGTIKARGIENLGDGVMTINGGTYQSIDEGNGGAAVWNEATLTINGGTFVSTYRGSASDAYGAGCLNNSGTALITGGTFTGNSARTYAIISTGSIEITPAEDKEVTVWGVHGGFAADAGTAVINGGSYASEEYYGVYVSNDGMGSDPSIAAVTINGGDFTGHAYSVWIGSDVNDPVNSTISITGGMFEKPLNAQDNTREGAIVISGGTFSEAVPEAYCAEGYEPVANADGTYTVREEAPEFDGLSGNMLVIRRGVINGYYELAILSGIDTLNYAEVGFDVEVYNNGTLVSSGNYNTKTVYRSVKGNAGKVWYPSDEQLNAANCNYLFASVMKIAETDKDAFSSEAYVKVTPYAKALDGTKLTRSTFKIPVPIFFGA